VEVSPESGRFDDSLEVLFTELMEMELWASDHSYAHLGVHLKASKIDRAL